MSVVPTSAPGGPSSPFAQTAGADPGAGPGADAARHALQATLAGLWIPLVTPFRDGQVDVVALARLVAHLATQGVSGFIPCGSTGEAAMLDDEEQHRVLMTTLSSAAGLPVWMGVSGVRPESVSARLQALARRHPAVAGFLIAPPPYVKPSQAALVDFYRRVADASPRPILLYDIPGRTGVRLQTATLLALADHPRIVGLKDCSGDPAAAEALLADGRLALLSGNDDEMLAQLARGATGVIAASAHLNAAEFARFVRLMRRDRLSEARLLWRRLLPLCQALFAEPNPAPVKGALARLGWTTDECRAPLATATPSVVDQAMACL